MEITATHGSSLRGLPEASRRCRPGKRCYLSASARGLTKPGAMHGIARQPCADSENARRFEGKPLGIHVRRQAAWTTPIMGKSYMSEVELAAYWGISPKTLQRWRCEGWGPDYVKFGWCVRYSLGAAAAFEVNHLVKRRVARPPVAHDYDPLAPPDETKLAPEQEAVLGRMGEFLGSTRSVPKVMSPRSPAPPRRGTRHTCPPAAGHHP